MEKIWVQGNLADVPFPPLLFHIWQSQKSGQLKIKNDSGEKALRFKKGNIAINRESLDEEDFLEKMAERESLDPSKIKTVKNYAAQKKISLLKTVIELNLISPAQLWKSMEGFLKSNFFPLFDWPKAEYVFDEEDPPKEFETLFRLHTLDFILEGIRQMKNYSLIQADIPAENKDIQVCSLHLLNQIKLEPHERYLLHFLENPITLKNIYDLSELGKKESQKVIYALFSLGVLSLPQTNAQGLASREFSQAEIQKILEAFNSKCAYIFRYTSKEIGPLSLNVLEKCIKEAKPSLAFFFRDVRLREDGSIETDPTLKINLHVSDEESMQNLLRGLNEILAAEVLAVKKTLGNWHESTLVKNLKKIGQWE